MSEFTFAPAVRENTPMIVALAGPSGSGKTYSANELATGLAGGGKIAFIDTEGRRGLHYAEQFAFDYCELRAPYTPARFLAAWVAAEDAGYSVVVTDSYSDEYVGEGGLVDMAAAELTKMGGNQAGAWAKPKAQHKLGVRWMRQAHCHLIFCLRAEEKVKLEKAINPRTGREETVVVPIGWQPICEKNVPYEMTTSLMLTPDHPGVPRPIKLQAQHRDIFPDGKQITREMGTALAQWCAGGAPISADLSARGSRSEVIPPHSPGASPASDRDTVSPEAQALVREAWDAARDGMTPLRAFCGTNSVEHKLRRRLLGKDLLALLQDAASEADEVADMGFGGPQTDIIA